MCNNHVIDEWDTMELTFKGKQEKLDTGVLCYLAVEDMNARTDIYSSSEMSYKFVGSNENIGIFQGHLSLSEADQQTIWSQL